jgi:hypothetical protein
VFAMLAIALAALWIRSHYYRDYVFSVLGDTHYLILESDWNVLSCDVKTGDSFDTLPEWELIARPIEFEKVNWRWRRGASLLA